MHQTKRPAHRSISVLMLTLATSCLSVEALGQLPTGRLGEEVGTFLTIEGVRPLEHNLAGAGTKKDTRRLLVDTVNGEKLAHPTWTDLDNALLEVETRYVLRGYETGRMIGESPWIGKEDAFLRKHPPNQAYWSFHTSFIVTSVAEPAGVEIEENNRLDWIIRDGGKGSVKPVKTSSRASTPAARQ